MSQKVRPVRKSLVHVALGISGFLTAAAAVIAIFAGLYDWEIVIANGAFHLATVSAIASIATIHARYVTRHAACTQKTIVDEVLKVLLCKAEQAVREHDHALLETIKEHILDLRFDTVIEQAEAYLKDHDRRRDVE